MASQDPKELLGFRDKSLYLSTISYDLYDDLLNYISHGIELHSRYLDTREIIVFLIDNHICIF